MPETLGMAELCAQVREQTSRRWHYSVSGLVLRTTFTIQWYFLFKNNPSIAWENHYQVLTHQHVNTFKCSLLVRSLITSFPEKWKWGSYILYIFPERHWRLLMKSIRSLILSWHSLETLDPMVSCRLSLNSQLDFQISWKTEWEYLSVVFFLAYRKKTAGFSPPMTSWSVKGEDLGSIQWATTWHNI